MRPMLQFMAFCFLAAVVLLGNGLVVLAMVFGAVFFATPVVYIAWHVLHPNRYDFHDS